jgi:hypothetical protein
MTSAEAHVVLRPGDLVGGRYQVQALLGRGGMASVYRVLDQRSQHVVALKQLSAGADTARGALGFAQFRREYYTLCQLAHPSIIEVYDYGIEGQNAFYTMELLDGQDLRERGRMPWREVCTALRDVASSLAVLHSRRLLHRDLSARNVRCTLSGRAKLIDFGAMTAMGVVKHVVGTPPFVAPESLQLQSLDGRIDLYGLGTLAYWMLTARYPYPARSFAQLTDLWTNPPPGPRRYDPDLPEGLDQLVMQLVHPDREARPATAGEVMERLCGIAGLPLQELVAVRRAYLVAPALVGRESVLQTARSLLTGSMAGSGDSLLIEGPDGSGRSRILDACVLEAKLLGAVVLRGDAAESSQGEYGLIRSLCSQLLEALPEEAARRARPWADVLGRFVVSAHDPSHDASPERRELHAALRNWLLYVARTRHIVLAVDDVDDIDEPSAALLAALAHGARRRRLALFLTARSTTRGHGPLALLRDIAETEALGYLDEAQTRSLLESVFGEGDNAAAFATRIHQLADGNLRTTLELCEHLVERLAARYEAGSWTLPPDVSSDDLPASLTALLLARVEVLDADSRALADALSLTDPLLLTADEYLALTDHGELTRLYRAIDALVAGSVLVPVGARYRFKHPELQEQLKRALAPERARALHARLAQALEHAEDPVLYSHHLLLAGKDREAVQHILALYDDPRLRYSAGTAALLERAEQSARNLPLSLGLQLRLRAWVTGLSGLLGDFERFKRHAWPLLEALERGSGLLDYRELSDWPDPGTRMQEAERRATARHESLPALERGFSPAESRAQLARTCSTIAAMASVALDHRLLDRLPSLEPLFELHPPLRLIQMHIACTRSVLSARYHPAMELAQRIVARLEQPDQGGLVPAHAAQMRLGCRYLLAMVDAVSGGETARALVNAFEREPGHRMLAWRVRMIYELVHGNIEGADECRRRAELFALQDGSHLLFPGTTAATELQIAVYSEDLLAVKRLIERLKALAAAYPGWRDMLELAHSYYRRFQGDLPGAGVPLLHLVERLRPGSGQAWAMAIVAHVTWLCASGRAAEAVERGLRYLDIAWQEQILGAHSQLLRAVGEALSRVGRHAEAASKVDEHIGALIAVGTRGLVLGVGYESRARIAIAMGDDEGLHRFAQLCAREHGGARNAALNAKYQRLMREAELHGLAPTATLRRAGEIKAPAAPIRGAEQTASSHLLVCVGKAERAREGLRLLLEMSGASSGCLFSALDDGRLELVASTSDVESSPGFEQALARHLPPGDASSESSVAVAPSVSDASGRAYDPIVLYVQHQGRDIAVGIAALHHEGTRRGTVRRDVLETVADGLETTELELDPMSSRPP